MCKDFFKGLLGGQSAESGRTAAPAGTVVQSDTAGDVVGTDVVDALSMGREASGRVKLGGTSAKTKAPVVGLSL